MLLNILQSTGQLPTTKKSSSPECQRVVVHISHFINNWNTERLIKAIQIPSEVGKIWTWISWHQAIVLSLVLIVHRIQISVIFGSIMTETKKERESSKSVLCPNFCYVSFNCTVIGLMFCLFRCLVNKYLEIPFVLELMASLKM